MRDSFAETLNEIAIKNKKIYLIVADISPANGLNKFIKLNKNRYINVGVSEQTMVGIAAGLAMKGKKPFTYTISTFSLYRPFEMIRNDLCYQKLPVTIVGMGSGTVYANLGATHLSQEDISIARSIPNMQVICPCDPIELKEAVEFCATKSKKPTYLRIGKTGEKNFTKFTKKKWIFGKIRKLENGKSIAILTTGTVVSIAYSLKNEMKKIKINPSLYNCHTMKPFDYSGIKKIFKKYKSIIIIEDHSSIGGLSEIVKSSAFNFSYKGKIEPFSLQDKFLKCYSNQKDLLEMHGISVKKILNKIKLNKVI